LSADYNFSLNKKPELPAIAVDQAEGRFAQQKESLKR
jgi:hypothetical protein